MGTYIACCSFFFVLLHCTAQQHLVGSASLLRRNQEETIRVVIRHTYLYYFISFSSLQNAFDPPVFQYRLITSTLKTRIYFPLIFTEHLLWASPSAKSSFSFKAQLYSYLTYMRYVVANGLPQYSDLQNLPNFQKQFGNIIMLK